MRVVEADSSHLQRLRTEFEAREAVEHRLHVADEDRLPCLKFRRQAIFPSRHRGDAECVRLFERLLDEILVRAEVHGGPRAVVEIRLQHDQADERLAAARVRLQYEVAVVASGFEPLRKNCPLRWAKWPLVARPIELVVNDDRVAWSLDHRLCEPFLEIHHG